MQPRLSAISGKLKGGMFTLGPDPFVIGREVAADLCIADASVSRRHSMIENKADSFIISDLESLNGTFVNDVPVRTRRLEHGDRVRIGESQFLFLIDAGNAISKSSHVRIDEGQVLSGSTVQIRFDDALYIMARDLSALMKISTTINAIRGIEELQERLLQLLFEVVPAQHGAILLASQEGFDRESVFALDRIKGKETTVVISKTIAQQVLRDGVSLLTNDVGRDGQSTDSILESQAVSVMCVPLIMLDRKMGVLYLDTTLRVDSFNKDHLQLVTAISGIAAVAIENARRFEWLESENQRLLEDINLEHNMIGEGAAMQRVYHFISKLAPTDSTVLIVGESGTGKELAARAIHRNSKRAQKSFLAVNCAALTESLLESELFGHEKGAYTGAFDQKKGRLEIADGGTLFLDEIGELSLALQVKLLRVLQEREFERVGGTQTIKIDVRLITATNRDLEDAIKVGEFRQDLFYRLNVVSFEMPPLRERKEDIKLLASYFANKFAAKCNRKIHGISIEASALLTAYDWPGNVRELEHTIERAVMFSSASLISEADILLPDESRQTEESFRQAKTRFVNKFEREYIQNLLISHGGNISKAAQAAHKNRRAFWELIRKHHVNVEAFRLAHK